MTSWYFVEALAKLVTAFGWGIFAILFPVAIVKSSKALAAAWASQTGKGGHGHGR